MSYMRDFVAGDIMDTLAVSDFNESLGRQDDPFNIQKVQRRETAFRNPNRL